MPTSPETSNDSSGRGSTSAPRSPAPAHDAPAPAAPTNELGSTPGSEAAGTTTAPPTPMGRDIIQSQLVAHDRSLVDIVEPLVSQLAGEGITQADFTSRYQDPQAIKLAVVQKWCQANAKAVAVKHYAKNDPIAVQKFADVDAEMYLDDPGLKVKYYDEMHGKIKSGAVDRDRVYPVMKTVTYGGYTFKGKQVPAAEVSPYSSRNQSVATMFEHRTAATDALIVAMVNDELTKAGRDPKTVGASEMEQLKRKAFRHWLKSQPKPHEAVNSGQSVSKYPTWYHPGTIKPTAPAGGLAYNQMMTLGALQPEWYPEGTATLNITKANTAERELRKPTAFDGMASVLWVARNQPGQTYGVTGGGAGEFLEKGVTYGDVASSTVSIRSDDFVEEIQRLVDAAPENSSVMEEAMRGNAQGTDESTHLHQRITNRTTREAHSPGATVGAPGAASQGPQTGASVGQSENAAVSGGTYDRSRQTPVS